MGAAARQQGRLTAAGAPTARAYAEHLLGALGLRASRPLEAADEHPALAWARSGLMTLTGARDGPARMCPVPLAACADGALAALAALAPPGAFAGMRGAQLLAERAAITGHGRNGAIAPGGSCRLLAAADGMLAVNLAREEDWELVPAWLEHDDARDWDALARVMRGKPARALVERGREMGLALAVDEMPQGASASWYSVVGAAHGRDRFGIDVAAMGRSHEDTAPLVVDLSSLWAGPLCGQLLQRAGARVIKVESARRPDGARRGPRACFDLLNAGKASVALDFAMAADRARLRALVDAADIVIEGSRPRALRQLGIDAPALVQARPGLTWISITAHGRAPGREHWIGYGDDAAVAAGLSAVMREAWGEPLIVGDAIADPLTGLHAALAGWAHWRAGRGGLVELSLAATIGHAIAFEPPAEGWAARAGQWEDVRRREGVAPAAPRARAVSGLARPLGADAGILGQPGIPRRCAPRDDTGHRGHS